MNKLKPKQLPSQYPADNGKVNFLNSGFKSNPLPQYAEGCSENIRGKPTIGLALSGSGNRSTFYIGFLEKLEEAGIRFDYITACSGGSIVVSAYAAGQLKRLKDEFLSLTSEDLTALFTGKRGKGGLFSLDLVEERLRLYTNGLTFENSPIKMAFMAVELHSGELVELCIGDITKAARISCTMPGIYEPVAWGNGILVDGGLLCMVPLEALKKFEPDITIGIDMRTTPNIFSGATLNLKIFVNWIKRTFFIDKLTSLFITDNGSQEITHGTLSVLARSLDIVIEAKKRNQTEDRVCDLLIVPDYFRLKRTDISNKAMKYYYEKGVKTAEKYLPVLQTLIENELPRGKPRGIKGA